MMFAKEASVKADGRIKGYRSVFRRPRRPGRAVHGSAIIVSKSLAAMDEAATPTAGDNQGFPSEKDCLYTETEKQIAIRPCLMPVPENGGEKQVDNITPGINNTVVIIVFNPGE